MTSMAVIGFGHWGPNLARNVDQVEGAQLVEICDHEEERLAKAKAQFPHARLSKNPLVVLNNPAIDSVLIATPASTHYELVKMAIEHGKNVLVEKPLALSLAQGEELVELAEAVGTTLAIDHTYEYHPAITLIAGLVEEGDLGAILHATSVRLNLGIVRRDVNVLWNLAPHDISIILRLFGEEPNLVEASGACFLQDNIEDVASIAMSFPSGRFATVFVSWLSPRKSRELTLVGEKKMVVFDETLPEGRVKVYDKGIVPQDLYATYGEYFTLRHGDIHCPRVPNQEPLRAAVEDFVAAVNARTQPRSDGAAALRVLRVLDAAQESLRSKLK